MVQSKKLKLNKTTMAKRATGVGKNKTSRSRKTKKRLEIKRQKIANRTVKK